MRCYNARNTKPKSTPAELVRMQKLCFEFLSSFAEQVRSAVEGVTVPIHPFQRSVALSHKEAISELRGHCVRPALLSFTHCAAKADKSDVMTLREKAS